MRRILQLSIFCVAAGIVSACKPAESTTVDPIPSAGVRFVNAVPDTGAAFGLDFRFVDIVENSAAFRVTFRDNPQSSGGVTASSAIQYKAAQAGNRHFRIFLDDTLQSVASTVLKDSTVTLTAGHNYTFLLWGNARSAGADKMRLTVIDETEQPGSQVSLRVINATGAPIDASQYTTSVPATPTWANIAPYTVSGYQKIAPAQVKFNVKPAGGTTALFTDITAIPGQPVGTQTAGCTVGLDCDVTPGTTVPGSAVTLIVFPASVAGSKAPQGGAFANTAGSFMWDVRPPRQCSVSFGC